MMKPNWAEMHCENDDYNDDDYTGKDTREIEIDWGTSVTYICEVELDTYRHIPFQGEVIKMTRVVYDMDGEIDEFTELATSDYPHFIEKAAIKKGIES